jgi:hypothetical protein
MSMLFEIIPPCSLALPDSVVVSIARSYFWKMPASMPTCRMAKSKPVASGLPTRSVSVACAASGNAPTIATAMIAAIERILIVPPSLPLLRDL